MKRGARVERRESAGRMLTGMVKTGSMAAARGTVNPFRYRGYVYDEEAGLYYMRSGCYNTVWK